MMPPKLSFASVLLSTSLCALLGCTVERPDGLDSTNAPRAEASRAAEASQAATLVGQLVLPGDGGRRGVELHAWVADADGESQQLWILPDEGGRFAREFSGALTRVSVVASAQVLRFDAADLPRANALGQVDLGAIDLRELLAVRRVRVRAADGAPSGVVRVGAWIGAPHTGPFGEMPSLGSGQFEPVELGSETEWLLPPDAGDVHFLVERPDGPGRGTSWRSGPQQLFGPYEPAAFPLELAVN